MTARKLPRRAKSGSPSNGEPDYLVVGTIRRPHGLRGEMLMDVLTDFPERLVPGVELFVGARHRRCVIDTCRHHAHGVLIGLRGINTPEAAGQFRNQSVYVPAADRPSLPDGQYYHHQLLGSSVLDEDGHSLGILLEILQTGANDVYVVGGESVGELLLPAIEGVVLGIDATRHAIRVRVPQGMQAGAEVQGLRHGASGPRAGRTNGRHGQR